MSQCVSEASANTQITDSIIVWDSVIQKLSWRLQPSKKLFNIKHYIQLGLIAAYGIIAIEINERQRLN